VADTSPLQLEKTWPALGLAVIVKVAPTLSSLPFKSVTGCRSDMGYGERADHHKGHGARHAGRFIAADVKRAHANRVRPGLNCNSGGPIVCAVRVLISIRPAAFSNRNCTSPTARPSWLCCNNYRGIRYLGPDFGDEMVTVGL